MSDAKRIGPCRYLAASKPLMKRPPISFYRCPLCGTVMRGTLTENQSVRFICCGQEAEKLIPHSIDELPDGVSLAYDIVGGLNENCIRIFWGGKSPDWLYLETYTGGQHMEISMKKRPPAVFALAGEDAYAYCDKDPCEKCSFRCKNGFVLYAWYEGEGLFCLPINQIVSTRESLNTTKTQQHSQ